MTEEALRRIPEIASARQVCGNGFAKVDGDVSGSMLLA